MADPSRTPEEVSPQIDPKIRARLDEIASPAYEDPARRDLTTWDWVAILGFLTACAILFVAWGY